VTNGKLVNIGIPITAALLGFFGAIGGSYIASIQSERLWEKQEIIDQKKVLLNKQIELIERVSKLANSCKKYEAYQSYLDLQADIAQKYVECIEREEKDCIKPALVKEALEFSEKRADLGADYSSTLQLVSLYFGKDVDQAANELAQVKKWWLAGEPKFRLLLRKMTNELTN
jgi:hypothetical protein